MDRMTEFSLVSKESEILPKENVFDIRFSNVTLVPEVVAKVVGQNVAK